jgi:hypothetical protein
MGHQPLVPGAFSEELAEGAVEGIQICGVPIMLRRVEGNSLR